VKLDWKKNDGDSPDPDWKVRQCYMLLIASATEIVSGVENIWKSGPSAGHHTYPVIIIITQ
jgi:hypothetical protein